MLCTCTVGPGSCSCHAYTTSLVCYAAHGWGFVMPYKIFISSGGRTHHRDYWGLIRLLDRAKGLRFRDLSVRRTRPRDGDNHSLVMQDILKVLATADALLVIDTPVIINSRAVKVELAEAQRLNIPIIAVNPPRRRGTNARVLRDIVGLRRARWTCKGIVEAIREAVHSKPRPTARPAEPDQDHEWVADTAALASSEVANVRDDEEEEIKTRPPGEERPHDLLPFGEEKGTAAIGTLAAPPTAPKWNWIRRIWPGR
jgi:hypothetical protein